jgi:hypothetical protein
VYLNELHTLVSRLNEGGGRNPDAAEPAETAVDGDGYSLELAARARAVMAELGWMPEQEGLHPMLEPT